MTILLSNDDGIDAPGLAALEAALEAVGELVVVAPAAERSAQSHALTLHKPLRVKARGSGRYSVSGTPADCVYLACYELLDRQPELVVSGINRGANLGHDVHYSGTVAAAREGALQGVPAIAVSLMVVPGESGPLHYDTAAYVAQHVVRGVLAHGLAQHTLLNVNVPNVPIEALRGIKAAALGRRIYADGVVKRVDPFGRDYYWIGGPHEGFGDDPELDGAVVDAGFASVTPITLDPTDRRSLGAVAAWANTN